MFELINNSLKAIKEAAAMNWKNCFQAIKRRQEQKTICAVYSRKSFFKALAMKRKLWKSMKIGSEYKIGTDKSLITIEAEVSKLWS